MQSYPYAVRRNLGEYPYWAGGAPRLGRLDVELTERCNNACMHCCINLPANDVGAQARELSTAGWQDILRQAADLGTLSVRFTGGEPTLREDFGDLYLFARRLGLRVRLFTNARQITPQLADLLATVPPLDRIEVSVYGMRAASYEAATRCPGSFAEFRRGVSMLQERGVAFVVKGALLPPNYGELDAFEAWAAQNVHMDAPPSLSMFFDLRGRRDSEAKNRLIASLRISPERGAALLGRRKERHRQDMAEFCAKFMAPLSDRLFSCGAGDGAASVDAYGMLQPCMSLRAPALAYDLKQGSLRDALTGPFLRLREMRASNPDYLAHCARCFLGGLCQQCPGRSWAEHGTLDTPVEYFCQVAHAQAVYLGLLAEGERAWEVSDARARIEALERSVCA